MVTYNNIFIERLVHNIALYDIGHTINIREDSCMYGKQTNASFGLLLYVCVCVYNSMT